MIERLRSAPRRSPQDAIDALLGLIGTDTGVGDDIAILAAQVAGTSASVGARANARDRHRRPASPTARRVTRRRR